MSTTLCLLTLNELLGCERDVPLLPQSAFERVFAIDGGSTDGTVEYLHKCGIEVRTQTQQGLNDACWSAIMHCDTEFLVFFHPKGTTPCGDAVKIKDALEKDGYDLVVASRNRRGGRNEEDDRFLKPRKWFVTILAILASAWRREGPMIWDVLHGFRGVRKSAFITINPPKIGATVDLAMVVRSYRHRLKCLELPTTETKRLFGETHFKILPTGFELLLYLIKEAFRLN